MTAYKQLVPVDLSVSGRLGFCLQYVRDVYGMTKPGTTAWRAWQDAAHKHTDSIPGDVAVPCWFSYFTKGQNYGHVVVSVPGQGFYSSPYATATGHNVLSSIAEVEQKYGAKYVGWSEDLLGTNVIEGVPMYTNPASDAQIDATINYLHWGYFGKAPADPVFESWRGLLKNNYVEGLLTICGSNDTSPDALKNKPTSGQVKPYTPPQLYVKE